MLLTVGCIIFIATNYLMMRAARVAIEDREKGTSGGGAPEPRRTGDLDCLRKYGCGACARCFEGLRECMIRVLLATRIMQSREPDALVLARESSVRLVL